MIDFRNINFSKIFTPFNFILVGIFATSLYAIYISYSNWATLNKITQAAPGHVIQVTEAPANLTVTLFYDYQCPFCYQIDPIVRTAAEQDGEVELLFKFLPFFGERSEKMGYMAFAAGQQGKFLEVHDYFIEHGNRPYEDEDIKEMTSALGLDHDRFVKDMNSSAAKQKIEENMSLAMSLGVYSTPTLYMARDFFVPQGGMPDEEKIKELFDQARQRL